MKVIFEETFLSKLQNLGNTVVITKCIIGSYYKVINNISELFQDSYLSSDIRSTGDIEINAVWEKEEKILKINLEINSENSKENLSENEHNFIYCYYQEPGEEFEKIAFILSGELEKSGNEYKIDSLDLSISRNLIDVIFPNTTLANIKTTKEVDTDFLEGYGIQLGTNIFTATETNDLDNNLVSRSTYFKYLRNKKTSGESNDLPYLNINGEEIYNQYKFTIINSINIYTLNTSYNEQIPKDSTLSKDGGEIQILGEYNSTTYTVKNDKIIEEITKTNNLIELKYSELSCIENNGMNFEYDESNNKIKYSKIENKDSIVNGIFIISSYCYNPITNETIIVESNKLNLSQESEASYEITINSEYFIESGRRLYLFNNTKEDIKTFTIKISGNLSNLPISITDLISGTEESFEHTTKHYFFDVTYETVYVSDRDYTEITVTLKPIQNNDTLKWYPVIEDKSTLILTTFSIGEDYSESFYMVQSPKTEGLKLYKKEDEGNDYEEIVDNITIPDTGEIIIYPASENEIETNDPKYWKIISRATDTTVSNSSGELNSENTEDWTDEEELSNFLIKTTLTDQTVYITELGNLIIGRVSDVNTNISLSNWRDLVNISRLTIPIKLTGTDANINVSSENLEIKQIGVYEFKLISNCSTKLIIYGDGTNNKSNNVVFFDNDSTTLELDEFDNINGITIFLKHIKSEFTQTTDDILDYGEIVITPLQAPSEEESIITKTIKLNFKTYTPKLEYVNNGDNSFYLNEGICVIFLDSNSNNVVRSESFKYYSVITTTTTTTTISEPNITLNFSKNSSLPNRGYNWSEFNYTLNSSNLNWPCILNGGAAISSTVNNNTTSLVYFLCQMGPTPSIELEDKNNFVYLSYSFGSYKNIYFRSSINDISSIRVEKEDIYPCTVALSTTTTSGLFQLRISSNTENISSSSKKISTVTIKSFVDLKNFTVDGLNIAELNLTQEDVDRMVKPVSIVLQVYQNSKSSGNIIINGSTDTVAPEGETREFTITSSDLNYTCELEDFNDYSVSTLDYAQNKIITVIKNILDENYKSFILKNTESSPEQYTQYSQSRTIGFNAKITSSGISSYKTIELEQLGYYGGFIYRSNSNKENTLYIDGGFGNGIEITEQVTNTTTTFEFFLGLFKINSEIKEGSEGKTVNFSTEGNSDVRVVSNIVPYYYSDGSNNQYYNVVVSFSQNSNVNENRTLTLIASAIDDITATESKMRINIIQTSREYTVLPSSNYDYVYFHSSGNCIQYGNSNLDIIDEGIETNIPENKNIELTVKDNKTGIEYNYGEEQLLGFKGEAIYVGPGTSFSSYSRIMRLTGHINSNASTTELLGDYVINLRAEGDSRVLWSKKIRQGYTSLYLVLNYDNPLTQSFLTTGEEAKDQIQVSGYNSSVDRVIFPVRIEEQEYDSTGGILKPVSVDIKDEDIYRNIKISNQKWTNSDTGYVFTGNQDVFEIAETQYKTIDTEFNDQIPFIENVYTPRQSYQSTAIPIKINFGLSYQSNFEYSYTLNLLKISYEEYYITIDPSTSIFNNLSTSKQDIIIIYNTSAPNIGIEGNYDEGSNYTSWILVGAKTKIEDKKYQVSITISENTKPYSRQGKIVFSDTDPISGKKVEAEVIVNQIAAEAYITCDSPARTIDKDGGKVEFIINTNLEEVLCNLIDVNDNNWISYTTNQNGNTITLSATVNENSTINDRSCGFIIKGTGEFESKTLTLNINQQKGTETLNLNPATLNTFTDKGGEETITVNTNADDYEVSIPEEDNWIEIKDKTKNRFTVKVSENDGTSNKNSSITIKSIPGGVTKSLQVVQTGKSNISFTWADGTERRSDSIQYSNTNIKYYYFLTNLNTNDGDIKLEVDKKDLVNVEYVILSSPTSDGDGYISVQFKDQNSSEEAKTVNITATIFYKNATNISKSIYLTASQNGIYFLRILNEEGGQLETLNLGNDRQNTFTVFVNTNVSNLSNTVEIGKDWISFVEGGTSSVNMKSYIFRARASNITKSREGKIRFYDYGNSSLYDELTIIQPGIVEPTITLEGETLGEESTGGVYNVDIPNEGGTLEFSISSNYPDSINVTESLWVANNKKESTTTNLKYVFEKSNSSNSGEITITSSYTNEETTLTTRKYIRITQSAPETGITLKPKEVTVESYPNEGEDTITTSFTVISNYPTNISKLSDWISSIIPSSLGEGGGEVTITVNKNNSTSTSRNGQLLIINTNGSASEYFNITQNPSDPNPNLFVINTEEVPEIISYTGEDITITVSKLDRTTFEIENIEKDWIKKLDSEEDLVFKFTVDPNDTTEERESTITIKAINREGESNKKVTIKQEGKPSFNVDENELIVSASGETKTINITSNNVESYTVKFVEETTENVIDWIKEIQKTETQLNINILENTSTEERKGRVLISAKGIEENITITVIQSGAQLTIETEQPDNTFNIESIGGSVELNINTTLSNYDISIENEEGLEIDWIEKDVESTIENHYKFNIAENTTTESRVGYIRTYSDLNEELTDKITINQEGTTPEIVIISDQPNNTFNIDHNSNIISFSVNTNLEDYELSVVDQNDEETIDWIIEKVNEGLENQFEYEIKENTTAESRTGYIKVFSGETEAKLTINQTGQITIDVPEYNEENGFIVEPEGGKLSFTVNCNIETYNIEVGEDVNWITENTEDEKDTPNTRIFDIAPNDTGSEREGTIIITAEIENLNNTKTLTIKQNAIVTTTSKRRQTKIIK